MLTVTDLSVSYGKIRAIRGISLHLNEGEAIAVLGSNGAGKSTLLKTISGELAPDSGSVEFRGARLRYKRPEATVRLGISHVPEGRHIFGSLTVRENLLLGITPTYRSATGASRIEDALEFFPALADFLEKPGSALSGGQQQQLAIGRALLTKPSLLMLDEPSLGLSPVMVDSVFGVIRRLKKEGTAILLVEQNATRALELVDRAYGLRTGTVQFEGTGAELAASQKFGDLYLGGDDN